MSERHAHDLEPFCSGVDREYLATPFTHGEFTYATNGHILVRVAKRPGVRLQDKAGTWDRPLEGIEAEELSAPPAHSFPTIDPDEFGECAACDGRGTEHECPECKCVCGSCDGTGCAIPEKKVSTTLLGQTYNLRYVRMVLSLPSVTIGRALPDRPLLFRFNGGVGALMPMRAQCEKHVEIVATEGRS